MAKKVVPNKHESEERQEMNDSYESQSVAVQVEEEEPEA